VAHGTPGHVHGRLAVPLLRTTAPAAYESAAKLSVVMTKVAALAAEARVTAWSAALARAVEDRLAAVLAATAGTGAMPSPASVIPVANVLGASLRGAHGRGSALMRVSGGALEALVNALPLAVRFPALDLWRIFLLDPAAVTHYATVAGPRMGRRAAP
jgi:hypothetical protein